MFMWVPLYIYYRNGSEEEIAMQMKMKYKNKAELVAEVYGPEFVTGMFDIEKLYASIVDDLRKQDYNVVVTRRGLEIVDNE
jgi:hypothetical protein